MNSSHFSSTDHLLREYTTLEYILLGDLRDLLEESANSQTSKWLVAILDALLDTLPREFDLKEQGGYLTEVTEQYPTWSDQVEHLRTDHIVLSSKLQELRDSVAQRAPFEEIANEVRHDLCEWMRSIHAHHRHENRLVQTAMNLEIGVGD